MRASQIETEFPLRCVVTERTDTLATRLADTTARRRPYGFYAPDDSVDEQNMSTTVHGEP